MTTRAVIYARQSLDRSGEGAAVERQVTACRRLARDRGWSVVRVLTDNDTSASGRRSGERPGYRQVLDMIRAGSVERVIVWQVDRLARRLTDLETITDACQAAGVSVATVGGDLDLSTDAGRMLAGILASVAKGEVERKGTRQRAANAQRAARGEARWTRRPFGYDRRDGEVFAVLTEADLIRDAVAMVLDGSTLAAGVRMLDQAGARTTTGGRFSVTTLRRVLLNPRLTGRALYNGADVAAGTWPPILTAEEQERVAEMLRDPRRRVQQGTQLRYWLSGCVRCGRCGGVMYALPMKHRERRWVSYACKARHLARRVELVDEVVEGIVLARLARPDAAALLVPDVDLDALRSQAAETRARRDALAGMLADGLLSAAAVREQAGKLTSQLGDLEGKISAALGDGPVSALAGADDARAVWDGLDLRTRREVVDVLAAVTILPAGKGVRFDPASVVVEWKT